MLSSQHNTLLTEHNGVSDKSTRDGLVASMRGTRVLIPDLQKLVMHWPAGINVGLERLDGEVQQRLDSIFESAEDATRLSGMKNSGVALFGASWWAGASYDALRIATFLSIWLFAWDDETDSHQFSSMIKDFDKSSRFRNETLLYITANLSQASDEVLDSISINPIITNFREVGDAICRSYNERQVKAFLKELRFYVEMTEEEHKLQTTDQLPTVEEYLRRRMGSSAVGVCLGIQEYTLGITVPEHVMQSEGMRAIHRETNIIISITNDILSIGKEIDQSQVDTLIPLLYMQLGTVQYAIDWATEMVQASVKRFEDAESDVLARYKDAECDGVSVIHQYIDACKTACTANLNWSLSSGRYKLGVKSTNGGVQVTL